MAFNTFREKLVLLFDRVKIKKSLVVTGPTTVDKLTSGWTFPTRVTLPLYGRVDIPCGNSTTSFIGCIGSGSVLGVGGIYLFRFSSESSGYNPGVIVRSDNSASAGLSVRSPGFIGFASGDAIDGGGDTGIRRDNAGILAQRNDTDAQESRLYATYTSATNYQRLSTKTIKEALTATAGATKTSTITIPAYSQLIGVTTRVTTALGTSNGTTGYQVGDGTDPDLWGAITGIANRCIRTVCYSKNYYLNSSRWKFRWHWCNRSMCIL